MGEPRHEIVLGVPGSGKTTYARALVARLPRLVIFDPGGDYEDMKGAVVVAPEEFGAAVMRERLFRVVVAAGRSDRFDVADEFCHVAQRCRESGNLMLLGDEVGDYNAGRAQRALRNLHRNGHKQGVNTILVSQRAVDIPLGCRATASLVASFLQEHPTDLDALAEVYGQDYAERVRTWEPGEPPVVWRRRRLYR